MDDSSRHSESRVADFLVDYRGVVVCLVIVVTALISWNIPHLKTDPTFESAIWKDSASYHRYMRFTEQFGKEIFLLIAVETKQTVRDPAALKRIEQLTRDLEAVKGLSNVLSIANLRFFREEHGRFGAFPLLETDDGEPQLPPDEELKRLKSAFPPAELLISDDAHTVGLLGKVDLPLQMDIPAIRELLERVRSVVQATAPSGSDFRIVGPPVIWEAMQRYTIRTAIKFGLLCFLIGNLVSLYIFKSVRVGAVTALIAGISAAWVLGLMSLFGIALNSVTSLAFGMVMIVTATTVIHIVTHFLDQFRAAGDRESAIRRALGVVARPCLMCSVTTAAGFASITVSPIPLMRQLGAIMSLSVMCSFILAIALTPAFFTVLRAPDALLYRRMSRDWMAVIFERIERFVFGHYRVCTALVTVLLCSLAVGIPRVGTDALVLRMLADSTKVAQDIHFVDKHLATIHSMDLVVDAGAGAFRKPEAWKKIKAVVTAVGTVGDVISIDSPLGLLRYLQELFSNPGASEEELFSNPKLVPQLLTVVSLSTEGKRILARYLDPPLGKVRLTVRIRKNLDVPLVQTAERIRSQASAAVDEKDRVYLTGYLALFAEQAVLTARSQKMSFVLAFCCITLLMIMQLRSGTLGLLSLIPNLLPVAVIFGLMGWLRIPLDPVTVFAAAVSIGLSVDDTIHYLTQVRRQIHAVGEAGHIRECLWEAYQITGKALLSTSAVLFFALLSLINSPFSPIASFGFLGAVAIFAALIGDLVFLPALILSFPRLGKLLTR